MSCHERLVIISTTYFCVILVLSYVRFYVCDYYFMPSCFESLRELFLVKSCVSPFRSFFFFLFFQVSNNVEIVFFLFPRVFGLSKHWEKIVIHKYEKANRIYDYLETLFGLLRFYNGCIYSKCPHSSRNSRWGYTWLRSLYAEPSTKSIMDVINRHGVAVTLVNREREVGSPAVAWVIADFEARFVIYCWRATTSSDVWMRDEQKTVNYLTSGLSVRAACGVLCRYWTWGHYSPIRKSIFICCWR